MSFIWKKLLLKEFLFLDRKQGWVLQNAVFSTVVFGAERSYNQLAIEIANSRFEG
jgi:hypothetical protein